MEVFTEKGIVSRLPHASITTQSWINSGSLSFGEILKIYHMKVCVGSSEAGEYSAHFSKAFKIQSFLGDAENTPHCYFFKERNIFTLFFSIHNVLYDIRFSFNPFTNQPSKSWKPFPVRHFPAFSVEN